MKGLFAPSVMRGVMVCVIALSSVTAFAADASLQVKQWLAPFRSMTVVRGEFEQQKKMPLLSRPFLSQGKFLSVKDKGLVWDTLSPVPSKLIMTPGQLVQEAGGRQQVFKATGTGFDGLALLLPSLLNGDLKQLQNYFALKASGIASNWTLSLTPKPEELVAMIQEIVVTGGQGELKSILLSGADKDTTHIVFRSFHHDTKEPGQKELAAFE